jgi:hypothetical protein
MERGGIKINGSMKIIGFVILIAGSTVSVVTSIEGMRGDIRVNTTEVKNLREDVKEVRDHIDDVEEKIDEHIKEDK